MFTERMTVVLWSMRLFDAVSTGCVQVSKYFSEIFKKLAPQGHAVLVMKKGELDQQVSGACSPPTRTHLSAVCLTSHQFPLCSVLPTSTHAHSHACTDLSAVHAPLPPVHHIFQQSASPPITIPLCSVPWTSTRAHMHTQICQQCMLHPPITFPCALFS